MRAAEQPLVLARRAPGDYDIIAAVDLVTVDEAFAGLHAARTFPNKVDMGAILSATELAKFAAPVLRGIFSGIPDGANVFAGNFRITAGPKTAPVPGTNHLGLSIPFALELVSNSVSPIGHVTHTLLTEIRGALSASVAAEAHVNANPVQSTFHHYLAARHRALPSRHRAHDSPCQPLPAVNLDAWAILLGNVVRRFVGPSLPSTQICPFIQLPKFDATRPLVRQIDLRTATSATGGAIIVGTRIGGPQPDPGDPARLTDPFSVANSNLYLRIHEQFIQDTLDALIRSGDLQKLAREQSGYDDVEVESATASVANNAINIDLTGKLPNACAHIFDAPFKATLTISFAFQSNPNQIVVSIDTSVGPDWGSGWTYVCILASLVEGALAFFSPPSCSARCSSAYWAVSLTSSERRRSAKSFFKSSKTGWLAPVGEGRRRSLFL